MQAAKRYAQNQLNSKAGGNNEEYINKFYLPVHQMVLKFTGSSEDAHHLTSLSFGQYFELPVTERVSGKMDMRLFKLALNNSLEFLLRRNQTQKVKLNTSTEPAPSEPKILDYSTDEPGLEEMETEMLDEIFRKLKPSYSQVLKLKYLKNYSLEEIASEMQLSAVSVQSKLFHGRKLVNDLLRRKVGVN